MHKNISHFDKKWNRIYGMKFLQHRFPLNKYRLCSHSCVSTNTLLPLEQILQMCEYLSSMFKDDIFKQRTLKTEPIAVNHIIFFPTYLVYEVKNWRAYTRKKFVLLFEHGTNLHILNRSRNQNYMLPCFEDENESLSFFFFLAFGIVMSGHEKRGCRNGNDVCELSFPQSTVYWQVNEIVSLTEVY